MKKIIYLLGVIFLAIVIILNVLFTAHLDAKEHIVIEWHDIIYIVRLALLGGFLFWGTKRLDKHFRETDEKDKKKKKIILVIACVIYVILNILWVALVRIGVGGDQVHVCNLAQTFYRGDLTEFLPNVTYAGIPLSEYILEAVYRSRNMDK